MSGHDPVSALLSVFQEITGAAEKYKITEPDRESRGLARGIANEKIQFEETAKRLNLVTTTEGSHSDSSWTQRAEERLVSEKAAQILHDMESLTSQLLTLKTDLINAGRKKEVLDKIQGRAFGSVKGRDRNSRTRLQRGLDGVANTNRLLASRLSYAPTLLSRAFNTPDTSLVCQFITDISQRAVATFSLLNEKYACCCHEPHVVYLGCPATTNSFLQGGLPPSERTRPLKVTMVAEEENETQGKSCSFTDLVDKPGKSGIQPLREWMSLQRLDLDGKRRTELALQLSLAVIELSPTSWIDESWTWDDWAISTDQRSRWSEGLLLFRRQFGSSSKNDPQSSSSSSSTMWSIPSHEPVLAKLGICLIELAFGKALSEIRLEDGGYDSFNDHSELDADSLDLITAKKMFMSQRIRYEFGEPFEDAVRACVHQQFRAEKSDNIVDLDRGHPSFLQNAVTSIISPLQLQMKKYFRAGHRDSASNKAHNFKGPNVPVAAHNRSTDVNKSVVVEPPAPHILLQDKNQPQPNDATASSLGAGNGKEGAAKAHFRLQSTEQGIRPLKINLPERRSAAMPSGARNAAPSPRGPQVDAEKTRGRGQHISLGSLGERSGLRVPSPSDQSQEDSEWAYGSVTETTESAHASVADALDQPLVRTDHPLLSRITEPMLRVFLDNFDAWRGRPAGSTRGTTRPSATRGRGGVPSRKRGRNPPNRGRLPNDEGDDNEDDDNDADTTGGRKRPRPDDDNLTLACPFFKKDSRTHGSCCGKRLTRIRDVKQHLKRRHYMPIYCPICYLIFGDEMSRDNHTNEFSCQRGRNPRPEGINLQQQNELGKRASRQLTEDQQWFGIFAILFPNDPPPSSAYIDPSLLDSADAYQDFVRSEGSGILYQFLESRGALNWNVPRGLDLEAFQRQMLAEGLVAISAAWSREEAQAPAGISGARPALSSENESLDVVNVGSGSPNVDMESVSSFHPASTISSVGHPGYALSHTESQGWQYENPPQDFVVNISAFDMTEMNMLIDNSMPDGSLDWPGLHNQDYNSHRR